MAAISRWPRTTPWFIALAAAASALDGEWMRVVAWVCALMWQLNATSERRRRTELQQAAQALISWAVRNGYATIDQTEDPT